MDLTILTGKRPKLLQDTLESVKANAPELLQSRVVVLHNGGDEPTSKLLKSYGFIDQIITTADFIPIGAAISQLMRCVQSDYVLHLEDDWHCEPLKGWFDLSKQLLETYDLVKLRHTSERTLGYNMVDRQPLVHTNHLGYIENNGHYSFNPSLQKRETVQKIFPCDNETDAQRKFYDMRGRVAQLDPGMFYHTGDCDSLRETVGSA